MLKRYFIVLFAFHGLNQKIYSSVFARKEDSLFSSTPVNNKPSPKTMIIQNKHDSLPNLDALNFSSTSTRPISSGNGLTPSFNERSLSSLNFTPSVSGQTPNYDYSRDGNVSPVGGPDANDQFRNRRKPQVVNDSDDDEIVSSSRKMTHDDTLDVSNITVAAHDSSSSHNISTDTDTSAHDQDRLDHSLNDSVQSLTKGGKPTIDFTSSMKLHSDHIFKVLKTDKTSPFDGGHASGTWRAISTKYPAMIGIKSEKAYSDGTVEFSLLRPKSSFVFTKTEFPARWSNQDIVNNTLRVYAFPDSLTINKTSRNNKSSSSSETKAIEMTGIVDKVNIIVIVKRTITIHEQKDDSSEARQKEAIKKLDKTDPNLKANIASIRSLYPPKTDKVITAINDEIITAYPIHAGSKNEDEPDDEASMADASGKAYSGPKSK